MPAADVKTCYCSWWMVSIVCGTLVSLTSSVHPGDQQDQKQPKPPSIAFSEDEKRVSVHYDKGAWIPLEPRQPVPGKRSRCGHGQGTGAWGLH